MLNRRSFFAASAAGIAAVVLPGVEAGYVFKSSPPKRKGPPTACFADGTPIGPLAGTTLYNRSGRTIKAGEMIFVRY